MTTRLTVVLVLITVGYLALIVELVRRRQLREKYALLWLGVGVIGLVLGFIRPLFDRVSIALGIQYSPSAVFLLTTVFLLLVSAHLSWEVSRLEERTRKLGEEIGLLQARRPRNRSYEDDATVVNLTDKQGATSEIWTENVEVPTIEF